MPYIPLPLPRAVTVRRLYSLYYFEFATGYVFPGEAHNFWEMVYIDQGEADIGAGTHTHRLGRGQVIFHQPNEFHRIWAHYADAPNLLVLTFDATPAFMRAFRGLTTTLTRAQRQLLHQLVQEGRRCFGPLLGQKNPPAVLADAPKAGLQLLANYLEQFLILVRRDLSEESARPQDASQALSDHESVSLLEDITAHMRLRLDGSLRIPSLCAAFGISASGLKQLFRVHAGIGVMTYYRRLRLEEARRLLRDGRLNISQVAEALGYSSVHAFSRQFKENLGISPSAYVRSIQ